jgi:2-polyprenyl-6-methoxyphenol hydroxylase-like FAD-dependent oxidoreductase
MSATQPLRRAVVVGGSLGGLITAHLLKRAGWRVQVNERVAEDISSRGAGLATHPELVAAFRQAGLPLNESLGVAVSHRSFVDAAGAERLHCSIPQVLTSWNRLFGMLRQPLAAGEYLKGRRFVGAQPAGADGIAVQFADGSVEHADLLVGADGLRSSVRALCDAQSQPQYAGYVAWRGRLPAESLQGTPAQGLLERFTISMRAGEQFIGYPVPAADGTEGAVDYNWLWYRPAPESTTLRAMCTDAQGVRHDGGIPPPLIRPQLLEQLRADAARTWAASAAEAVARTPAPFFQPIYDMRSRRLVAERVALVGDAAFVARPHCGMGVTKAAGDAVALVRALQAHPHDLGAALAGYEQERLHIGRLLVDHACYLGSLLQSTEGDAPPPADVMNEVLTKTAVPPDLESHAMATAH